jgi:hypothetical protein
MSKLPPGVRKHLEYRLNEDEERQLTPKEKSQLQYWISTRPRAYEGENWYKDFGTFYAVGQGELWKSVLTSKKDSQGIVRRMKPHSGDHRLASTVDGWLERFVPWQK